MKKFLFIFVFLPVLLFSQDEKKFGIQFSGFVKTDIFYDSRQTIDAREGHFLLYPAAELPDVNGNDINARSKFNILAIQTRLTGKITGPDALGAKTSGLIEGAFFGNIASDINGFRLRHAFVKLTWPKTELMVGQFWHPMFVTDCFPGTVSFNTGAPFEPFSRNPQIRVKQKFGSFNAIATALEQVDFKSTGPDKDSPKYLINSGIPELNLRFEYNAKKILVGAGVNYKTLLPSLANLNESNGVQYNYKTDEKASGTSFFGYVKLNTSPVTIRLYGVAGQMMYSMTMLGGYATMDITKEPLILATGDTLKAITNTTYTPIKTTSFWVDANTNGKKLQVGLFAGYSKNGGATDDINGTYYSRGSNIDYLYRVAPRLIFNSGKFRIAPEIEYTVAAYGTTKVDGTVKDAKEVGNLRFLLGVYYFF